MLFVPYLCNSIITTFSYKQKNMLQQMSAMHCCSFLLNQIKISGFRILGFTRFCDYDFGFQINLGN